MKEIRNFSIIAHIDHGKSTMADRFISACHGLTDREMTEQVLDSMDLERERGITIKAQTATLDYVHSNGEKYTLNLIDTPGHADFSYEVSRSLYACEGALLIVDAAQGVQAQTLANYYKAVEQSLEVVPVLNKIDLPAADIDKVGAQIRDIVGLQINNLLTCSAKTGVGITSVLDAIVDRIEPPEGTVDSELQALVVDSYFDPYSGVVIVIRIINGGLSVGDKVLFMSSKSERFVTELGRFRPRPTSCETLQAGEVGYLTAGIKELSAAQVGDTLTLATKPVAKALPGFRQVRPQLYASFFPIEADLFNQLRDAFDKLKLNDASIELEVESSAAFGQGIRCGFLGMLHMDIIQERLSREYNVNSIITAPGVAHEVDKTDGTTVMALSASEMPKREQIVQIKEPVAAVTIITEAQYLGAVMKLCVTHRATQQGLEQSGTQSVSHWKIPMTELITGFIDELKSVTHGFASLDYEPGGFEPADIVRVDVLVNDDLVEALSILVPRVDAEKRGRDLLVRLSKSIHRQQFQVPLQAVIGGKIIARENIKAVRKNVTAKCYGGDVTRKKKLLERQKRGKKRMRMFGSVEIPQEAFLSVLQKDVGNG